MFFLFSYIRHRASGTLGVYGCLLCWIPIRNPLAAAPDLLLDLHLELEINPKSGYICQGT